MYKSCSQEKKTFQSQMQVNCTEHFQGASNPELPRREELFEPRERSSAKNANWHDGQRFEVSSTVLPLLI